MISELKNENCWSLASNSNDAVLVAYLSRAASGIQLKALIELSDKISGSLRMYFTCDKALRVSANGARITGTPTYLLIHNGRELSRLLGEADAQRLKDFVALYLPGPVCAAQDKSERMECGVQDIPGDGPAPDRCMR